MRIHILLSSRSGILESEEDSSLRHAEWVDCKLAKKAAFEVTHSSPEDTSDIPDYEADRAKRKQASRERRRLYDIAKGRAYHAANREKILERKREYERANRAASTERVRRFREENPEAVAAWTNQRMARVRGAAGSSTEADIKHIYLTQKGKCATCKKSIAPKQGRRQYHIDHIMPISKGGSNYPDNLQLLCPRCNLSKNDAHPDEWAKRNGLLFC